MKSFNRIIALLLVAITTVSCSNDDNAAEVYQPRTNLLLKTTDSDDGIIYEYSYDTNNRLSNMRRNGNASNPALNQNFTYNPDGNLDEVTEAVGGAVVMKYFYSNNKVVRKEGRNGLDVYQYSYSGNTVTENYIFTTNNTGFRNVYTYDTNGNITQVAYYTNVSSANPLGTYAATETRTHDTKKNAYSSIPAAYLFPSSVNNIQTIQANSGPLISTSYEYNADNYPIKRIQGYTRSFEYRQL